MEVEQLKQSNLKIISFSEKGLRIKNDDKVYHKQINSNSYLFLLADGMGGYEYGDAAANTAIEIISKKIIDSEQINIEQLINESFLEAHAEVNKNYLEAGTTICGIWIKNNYAHVFWSGDVKAFIISGDTTFSTSEHTLLNLLRSSNTVIKGEEIQRLKNTVTRAIGGKLNNFLPEQVTLTLLNNFKILICSDGVHQLFEEEEIFSILKKGTNISTLNEIRNRSAELSKDNYSAILIESE
jgi:protein phosphatase